MGDLNEEQRGHVLWVRLNREERRNALSSAIVSGLEAVAERCERDLEIRCLVIGGSGSSFCAGADLKERGLLPVDQRFAYVLRLNHMIGRLDRLPIPVVAAINGHAMGGGVELALTADLRFAVERAEFGLPEVRWGIIPGGSIVRLLRDADPALAARLSFTADRITAPQARDLGLVQELHPTVEAMEAAAEAMALRIARNAPLALRAAKRLMKAVQAGYTANAMNLAMEIRAPLEDTEDSREGLLAFAEKREPRFVGR